MLADLAGPAEPGELAGEAAARLGLARNAFPAGISPAAHRSAPRRRSWMSVPGTVRLGGALIAAAVGLGGAAAAYAGALPSPFQNLAHRLIDAPPAHRASPPGPGQSGPGTQHRSRPGHGKRAHGQAKGHGKAKSHGKAKGHRNAKGNGKAKSKPTAATAPPGQAKHHAAHPAHHAQHKHRSRPWDPDPLPGARHVHGWAPLPRHPHALAVVQLYYIVSPRLPRIQRERA
jgi:hypothetical protein